MAMAMTVEDCLRDDGAPYDVVHHAHSGCSLETATRAHIPADRLMKSVILGDDLGDYMMAVLPADCRIAVDDLRAMCGRELHLASERELAALFADCECGAIPATGPAYGLRTLLDEGVRRHDEVYFEAGDHERLVRMSTDAFMRLMRGAEHARFGRPM